MFWLSSTHGVVSLAHVSATGLYDCASAASICPSRLYARSAAGWMDRFARRCCRTGVILTVLRSTHRRPLSGSGLGWALFRHAIDGK